MNRYVVSLTVSSSQDAVELAALLRDQGYTEVVIVSLSPDDTDIPGSQQKPGPLDGLAFAYIRQLLIERQRPLSAVEIANLLDFPVDAISRIVRNAVHHGRLVTDGHRYTLSAGER